MDLGLQPSQRPAAKLANLYHVATPIMAIGLSAHVIKETL